MTTTKFLVGSNYFFNKIENFESKDVDILELIEKNPFFDVCFDNIHS